MVLALDVVIFAVFIFLVELTTLLVTFFDVVGIELFSALPSLANSVVIVVLGNSVVLEVLLIMIY